MQLSSFLKRWAGGSDDYKNAQEKTFEGFGNVLFLDSEDSFTVYTATKPQ